MKDQDYIRKAVELADGWYWVSDNRGGEVGHDQTGFLWYLRDERESQLYLDALAAQLVRQVDATEHWVTSTSLGNACVWLRDGAGKVFKSTENDNRTMNTLRAIVDSGVLK